MHTGGIDLGFPHHEDEIAQSEAATGHPLVGTGCTASTCRWAARRWRSRPATSPGSPISSRAACRPAPCATSLIAVHYRAPLNYSDESLAAAAAAIERIDALLAALAGYTEERADDPGLPEMLEGTCVRHSAPASRTT